MTVDHSLGQYCLVLLMIESAMLPVQEAGNLEDPNWRVPDPGFMEQQYMGGGFTFGVPTAQHLDFSGPGGPALATRKLSQIFMKQQKSHQHHHYYIVIVVVFVLVVWYGVHPRFHCCKTSEAQTRSGAFSPLGDECSSPCPCPFSLPLTHSLTLPVLPPPLPMLLSPHLPLPAP